MSTPKQPKTGKTKTINSRDYYCSMKFRFLKIDLESKMTYNCHAAKPHPVDFVQLKSKPGELFNTDVNVLERQQMLTNGRNASCEQNCWAAEDRGATSPRIEQGGIERTHEQVITTPEIIDLTINGDCNLTCSYCSKEYSSSWRRDVVDCGDYPLTDFTDRYTATNKDRALLEISQRNLKNTQHYQALVEEIRLLAPGLKRLTVTGGEPFLDNSLVTMLKDLPLADSAVIEIYTGLGVEYKRFERIVRELKTLKNVVIVVSGENTGKFLEFNRYGNKYNDFVAKVNLLKSDGIQLVFQATLSNLTVHDFHNFYKEYGNYEIWVTFAYQPTMMAPYVLDVDSKQKIKYNIQAIPEKYQKMILNSIMAEPTEQQRINAAEFLKEFVRRRPDLDLSIYPSTFLSWLGINNVV